MKPMYYLTGPGAVATPIWDKSEAQDVSMYSATPYREPLAAFAKLMLEDGRSGHSAEHIARCAHSSLCDALLLPDTATA